MNQNFGSDLSGDSSSGSLMKLKSKCQFVPQLKLGFSHLKAFLGLEDLFLKWLSYMDDKLVLAIDR